MAVDAPAVTHLEVNTTAAVKSDHFADKPQRKRSMLAAMVTPPKPEAGSADLVATTADVAKPAFPNPLKKMFPDLDLGNGQKHDYFANPFKHVFPEPKKDADGNPIKPAH